MSDTITLSRGALFERVWSTPVRVLAAEYGISNIGLAKICRKMDIPMPGLGYWARVAHGQKPKKTKLPKATASTRTEYVLQPLPKKAPTEAIPRAPGTLPDVPIAEALRSRDLQEAIRSLLATLNTSKPERDGQVRLPGHGGSFVRLSLPAKERALLILDGLAKALELRGHQMRFTERQSNYQPYKLIAVVNDIEVQMGIVEPLIRSEHRLSPEEQARFKRTGYSWGPAYDFTPSGRLIFSMGGYSGTSYKWSDGARKKLEEQLGEVVLAFEDEAVRVVAARVAEEERQVRVQEEQRARDVVRVRANYEAALAEDLEKMAEQYRRATTIRDFLRALDGAVGHGERSESFAEWADWAMDRATRLDPLSHPESVGKTVRLDFSRLSEEQFQKWLKRSPKA